MNYKESKEILGKIKRAKRILVNCHRGPDPDSIGSALSLYQVLIKMNKKVEIVCPTDIPDSMKFLPYFREIKKIDFRKFDFTDIDLFIALDTPSPDMVTGSKDSVLPNIPVVVIDHHKTNPGYGKINLIDNRVSSAAELLYSVFEDWGVSIDKDMATTLLSGIIGDTGIFRYPGVTSQTFNIARELMDRGANKDEIIFKIFNSVELNRLKFWGEILIRIEFEKKYKFIWVAIPYEIYKKYLHPESGRESAASKFGGVAKGTDFSIIMTEERENFLSISFRSRTDFDVTKIAVVLGGGGHRGAAGAKIQGMEFEKAVEKVLETAKEIADENKRKN